MPRAASACPPEGAARTLARLRNRRDFLRLSGSRIKVVTSAFVLQARASSDEGAGGVGFTASRRVGGAVVRNRARRRLKALASQVLARRARPGWDYVLVARAEAATRPWSMLVADLEDALDRVELRPGGALP